MIDFNSIFDDDDGAPQTPEEARRERLQREDRDLFQGKRLHNLDACMSMESPGRFEYGTQVHRATRPRLDGDQEPISLVFKGQRRDDLKSGALLADMNEERLEREAKGDYAAPTRNINATGVLQPRTWTDREGRTRKDFDLVVATWTYVNAKGERITEGAEPTYKSATREGERAAMIREKASGRTKASPVRKPRDPDAVER